MSAHKNWMRKPLGFSLLELMVVVAILGVLATVAVPRFNIFRARSRQAEAKSNLGVIYTLQESFAIEREGYYDGVAATWGGEVMDSYSNADGYKGSGNTDCKANKLGFRLANCGKARYRYWMAGGAEKTFLALAFADSDNANGGSRRIFPGCDGTDSGVRTSLAPGASAAGAVKCAKTHTVTPKGKSDPGDGWCMDEGRNLENYFDIVEGCDN